MKRLLILVVPMLFPGVALADEYKKTAGPREVEVLKLDWKDAKRDRAVPVKVYLPKGEGPFPVVIFSHGLGGSRDGYEYLGRHWASHGYVSVHLQHLGSDTAVWENAPDGIAAMKRAAADSSVLVNRWGDVHFAIDELTMLDKSDSPLKGKLDLDKIAIAGHSLGSLTALSAAGQMFVNPSGRDISPVDRRIKAALAISPSLPRTQKSPAKSYGSIVIPTLHITGTKDESPIDPSFKAVDRQLPFENAIKSDRYLIVLEGADHMVFAQPPRRLSKQRDERTQNFVLMSTTAFLDAYLRHDEAAKTWLLDGLAKELKNDGTIQHKSAN
jgi:predicted dienelactone hydrolase